MLFASISNARPKAMESVFIEAVNFCHLVKDCCVEAHRV
jgi:hypothetical protein